MLWLADTLHAYLRPFIMIIGALLLALLGTLMIERLLRGVRRRLHDRSRRLCRPYVDAWLGQPDAEGTLANLVQACRHRRTAAAELLLAPLRSVRGDLVERSRAALDALGMKAIWQRRLRDRRWWVRADAAQAFGLVAEPEATHALVDLLDDDRDEVRAAAVEALGHIADPATLPAIVGQLTSPRHQRVRVVSALNGFGAAAAEPLVQWGRAHPDDRAVIAETLGQIGSASGLPALIDWIGDDDPAVRAACLRAVSDIGLDDRLYYYALRALADAHPDVRAMAARALGRSGRADASTYLAARLDDEWTVAAHSAAALRRLGDAGRRQLEAAAGAGGPGADLARRMLWEAGA